MRRIPAMARWMSPIVRRADATIRLHSPVPPSHDRVPRPKGTVHAHQGCRWSGLSFGPIGGLTKRLSGWLPAMSERASWTSRIVLPLRVNLLRFVEKVLALAVIPQGTRAKGAPSRRSGELPRRRRAPHRRIGALRMCRERALSLDPRPQRIEDAQGERRGRRPRPGRRGPREFAPVRAGQPARSAAPDPRSRDVRAAGLAALGGRTVDFGKERLGNGDRGLVHGHGIRSGTLGETTIAPGRRNASVKPPGASRTPATPRYTPRPSSPRNHRWTT